MYLTNGNISGYGKLVANVTLWEMGISYQGEYKQNMYKCGKIAVNSILTWHNDSMSSGTGKHLNKFQIHMSQKCVSFCRNKRLDGIKLV